MIPIRIYGADLRRVPAGACSLLLHADEIRRAEAIRNPSARDEFVKTRALLRLALADNATGLKAKDFVFSTGENGKPYLCGDAVPDFNVSHSGDMALIAVAPLPVGIDIELQNAGIDYLGVARAVFSPSERQTLQNLAPAELCQRFFSLWTRKEAYLKATGCGFAAHLDQISTVDRDRPIQDHSRPSCSENWYAFDLPVPETYKGALVTKTDNIDISIQDISGIAVESGRLIFQSPAHTVRREKPVRSPIFAEMR